VWRIYKFSPVISAPKDSTWTAVLEQQIQMALEKKQEPLKSKWLQYVPQSLNLKNPKFCTHSALYVFIYLRTNSDFFRRQHWLTGLYNREIEWLLRCTNWNFIYNSPYFSSLKCQVRTWCNSMYFYGVSFIISSTVLCITTAFKPDCSSNHSYLRNEFSAVIQAPCGFSTSYTILSNFVSRSNWPQPRSL